MEVDKLDHEIRVKEQEEEEEEEDEEVFYTPGPKELYDVRLEVLNYSLKQSAIRLQKLRQLKQSTTTTTTTTPTTTTTTGIPSQDEINILKSRRQLNSNLSKYEIYGSQFIPGNTRTISNIKISNNDKYIACGSWDGSINLLNSQDLSIFKKTPSGFHNEKISGLSWNNNDNQLVSGGNEGTINIWNVNENNNNNNEKDQNGLLLSSPIVSIKQAHNDRITKTLFHPINNLIISTSFDQTWKLWDLNKLSGQRDDLQCLVEQEGHSKPIFTGEIHPDSGLFMSGGLDGIVHIWDLRSGRSIVTLQKHMAGVYCLDWSPNGYQFVTGSGDCSLKIWDLRKLENNNSNNELYSIPAHTKLITDVKFYHQSRDIMQKQQQQQQDQQQDQDQDHVLGSEFNDGKFLVSCSYDGDVNIWSSDNWIKIKSLKGHTDKVMSCDINSTGKWIVSSGWDRSIKLWK